MCESKSILPNCSFKQKQQKNLKFTNIKQYNRIWLNIKQSCNIKEHIFFA